MMMSDRDLSTRWFKEVLFPSAKYWEEPETGDWLYELGHICMR